MSEVRIATDADLQWPEDLDIPTPKPFGHFIPPPSAQSDTHRDFVLVSEARGTLGFFAYSELAQPFLRMFVRNAHRSKGRLDFRLYRWEKTGWIVHQRTIALRDLGVAA